jgi:excisionase family DNA binding protein
MFLKPHDVAERLNVSLSTVYGLIESGKLACHRIGRGRGAVRVSEEDLGAYLESCRNPVDDQPKRIPARVKLKHVHL